MSRDLITINNKIMKVLNEILANNDIIPKVRALNFDKDVQVRDEIDELKTKKDEELELIILRNRYLGRLDRDTEEKRIDEIEKSIREKENELGDWFAIDNHLIDWLLELGEIKRGMKTMLKKNKIKR